jgi:hypothetical protein
MVPMVLEIFLPCYYGSEFAAASSKLSTALFGSEWIESDEKLKTTVKIFMENAKQDAKISAFGFFHVNLVTFRVIVHAAYSYYNVLKTMNRK